MDTFRVRIGKVTDKRTGSNVRLLHPEHDHSTRETVAMLRDHVDQLVATFEDDMVGYAIIVWDRAGRHASELTIANGSPVRTTLLPGFAAEAFRVNINNKMVHEVLDDRLRSPSRP